MSDVHDADQGSSADEAKPRFPYDDRPFHPGAEESRPMERLSGRGQTEGTAMGLRSLGWVILGAFALLLVVIYGGYLLSLLG